MFLRQLGVWMSISVPLFANLQFEKLANQYVKEFLSLNPETATSLGQHKYDDRLNDYSLAGIAAQRKLTQKYLDQLKQIPIVKLTKANSIDLRMMQENLEYNLFQIDVLRPHEVNPMSYNAGDAINNLISRDFAPLKDRLISAKGRLQQIPSVIAAAKTNLKNPPRIHTETAISQNEGLISLIKNELQISIEQAGMQLELAAPQSNAIAALEDYGHWLKTNLLPRSTGDFRLGDTNFRRKLKFALSSDMPKEELLKLAEADLKLTQDRMEVIARKLAVGDKIPADKKALIKMVLDKLAEKRPNNENIVGRANQYLKQTTDFVRAHNLVTLPTEPLKVIVMPEYARGSSVAYFDAAGPFEKKNTAFFTISPTPNDWTPQRKESYFKEYNNYMLQELTIHEAMPGHYLQIMHANKFKAATPIRALFSSGSFVEGWAVYAEQLMAEKGYGGFEVEMQQLKMRLRVIINAIIDQKIHSEGMSEKVAMDFMMNEGFQEEGEAAGKWKRAQLSSTQLSTYYVGTVEVNAIRKAYEAKHKHQVNLKQMHDEMLSFGSPPAKYVRELMGL